MMDFRELIFKMDIKVKIFGTFVILITVSYFLYSFSIVPLLHQRRSLRKELTAQQRLAEVRLASIDRVDSLEKELAEKKEVLKKINTKFLKEKELPAFFTELRNLIGESNVDIVNLTVQEKQPLSAKPVAEKKGEIKFERLPVNITLQGNYLDIIDFFAQLRKKPTLFTIPRISMRAEDETNESIFTDLQLVFYIIYEKTEE